MKRTKLREKSYISFISAIWNENVLLIEKMVFIEIHSSYLNSHIYQEEYSIKDCFLYNVWRENKKMYRIINMFPRERKHYCTLYFLLINFVIVFL
jgi:hypothetical protein